MKKIILLSFIMIFSVSVKASHMMGGEVTWECLRSGANSGKYIFTMKLYIDCSGSGGGFSTSLSSPIILYSSYPGVGNLHFIFESVTDMSPTCYDPSLGFSCPPDYKGGIVGGVVEYVFTTTPITLIGVPPVNGASFTYTQCCRNNSTIENIITTLNTSYTIHATMYPYNGNNHSTCYDSSPYTMEPPVAVVLTNEYTALNVGVKDPDKDSLHFEWDYAIDMDGINDTLAFRSGFLPEYPLPNTQFPSNSRHCATCLDPVLNPSTGEITFMSTIGAGGYVFVIKISAYRCGQLISETYRDFQVLLLNNTSLNNSPPKDTTKSYEVEVEIGDSVQFPFYFFDTDTLQQLTLIPRGSMFGDSALNSNTGCLYPPCARLTNINYPFVDSNSFAPVFKWQTDSNHVPKQDSFSIYHFYITVKDDACPIPSQKTVDLKVKVKRKYFSSIDEVEKINVSVYPNPYSDAAIFDLGNTYQVVNILLSDANGREVYTNTYRGKKSIIFNEKLPKGIYFYQLQMDNTYTSGKLVVQ